MTHHVCIFMVIPGWHWTRSKCSQHQLLWRKRRVGSAVHQESCLSSPFQSQRLVQNRSRGRDVLASVQWLLRLAFCPVLWLHWGLDQQVPDRGPASGASGHGCCLCIARTRDYESMVWRPAQIGLTLLQKIKLLLWWLQTKLEKRLKKLKFSAIRFVFSHCLLMDTALAQGKPRSSSWLPFWVSLGQRLRSLMIVNHYWSTGYWFS